MNLSWKQLTPPPTPLSPQRIGDVGGEYVSNVWGPGELLSKERVGGGLGGEI